MDVFGENQKDILANQATILAKFERYEGAWGAITIVATALGAILIAFKDEIVSVFHKLHG